MAVALIALPVATAVLVAAAARLPSLVSTLLLVYLAFVANLGLVTLALSPFHEVTRAGLAVAEGVLCAAALAAWALRGRPGIRRPSGWAAFREAIVDPVTALFLLLLLVLLAYELLLGLTVPPNNGDALAYHLVKAAAWAQHGGIYWVPQVPTVRINAFQPLAEQENLYLFVATANGALAALPQYLAELAILVAVYGAARRLGFGVRAAVCGACLLATFPLIALEATTAQNDLVAASFTAVAGCLLLGSALTESALAGAAAGIGLGAKLSTALALPVLAGLALVRGRRRFATALAGAVAGLAALGMWGYVLNDVHTGHVLGIGPETTADRGSPSYPGSVANAFYLMYGTMDLSVLSNRVIDVLAAAGALAAVVVVARARLRRSLADAARVATPFLAPILVLGGAGVLAFVARRWGFPIRGPDGIVEPVNDNLSKVYTRVSNEDYSAFGPVGAVALLAASGLAVWMFARGRADARQLVLAGAIPTSLVLMSLETAWNPFLVRFLAVPAVLVAPLLARLLRGPWTAAAYLAVAAITIGLTLVHDETKPLASPYGFGRPWNLTQVQSLQTNGRNEYAAALTAYDQLVPGRACVGAVLGRSDPSYLLFGSAFQHHVVYLDATHPWVPQVNREHLFYVVVSRLVDRWTTVGDLAKDGWQLRPLGPTWLLAVSPAPGARTGDCLRA